ncbi:MAG: hypothetical protein V7K22_12920 [Nostoc sp.]|uniref:hypothetical protein n=1 Tax=Nostoc sp. TaxID=1180 RepID=UPI002FF901D5
MTDAINPHQFASLDYADADMYGALFERPAPAIPLNRPQPIVLTGRENASERQMEKRLWDEEWKRTEAERTARKNADAIREQEITRRDQQQREAVKNRINGIEAPEALPPKSDSPLTEIPRSTPERQPLPSPASPPPTPNGTAARADSLVEPTALPRSATIREAIGNTVGGIGQSLPRSLPQAAGRLIVPGVGAGLTLAGALIAGQSVQQALTTTAVVTASSYAGGLIGTAVGGPVGFYVGSMIGGFAGGYLANALFPAQLPTGSAHLQTFIPNYPPFIGAQQVGGAYYVKVTYAIKGGDGITRVYSDDPQLMFSPIGQPYPINNPSDGTGYYVDAHDYTGAARTYIFARGGGGTALGVRGVELNFAYGTPDTGQSIVQPIPPQDNTPSSLPMSPIGNDNVIPSGVPSTPSGKRGNTRNVAPSKPSNNTPNGAEGFPGHGGLAPSYLPNPEHQPSNLGGMMPQMQPLPQRQSLPFAEPEDIAVPRVSPTSEGISTTTATNPSTFAYPAYVPETAKPVPIGDALSPVPKVKAAPIVKSPTETALDQQKKDFEEQIGRITAIATAIAAITPAIQGLPDAIASSPNVRAANKETTQGAVCEIAQPGGCLGNALDDSANKVNQNNNQNTSNLLDKINAGANAAQLALLELMNTKLGDLIPGGISGKLQRLSSWMHLDRVLNILIWWQTLHNAYMLSANLGQTLTSAISNVLAAIGIKDAEGSPLEIGEVLGHQFDSLAKTVIGESEWGGIKAEYKKWNRIYQAAANLMNSIQSIGYSILSALEVIGSWIASIGNALRKWGEVGDNAYRWMNPTPNFQNKFFTALETTENVVSQIDSVASEVLSVQETVGQIGEQKSIIEKALREDDTSKQGTAPPEATKVKASAEEAKTKSTTPELPQISSDTDKEADE